MTPQLNDVVTGVVKKLNKQFEVEGLNDLANTLVANSKVEYYSQDDFTVAVLRDQAKDVTYGVGVSKRNPTDNRIPLRGRALALSRAVQFYFNQHLPTDTK